MRKLKLQVQASIDGFMAGPRGEMDWLTMPWDAGLGRLIAGLTQDVDCIVLGRVLAEGFIPHWAAEPAHEPRAAIDVMNRAQKVVFTRTLTVSPWPNARLARGELRQEIDALKRAPGGDIIAYGGGEMVRGLVRTGLVDDLHLVVNPVALGAGSRVFDTRGTYKLVEASPFACGIVVMHYRPRV